MADIPPTAVSRIFELVARGYEPYIAAMIAKKEDEERKSNG